MATNLPSCLFIQFLEQLLKFLINFTLLKYVKSQRNYGFLITKELMFGFQILDLKDHFSASLNSSWIKSRGALQTSISRDEFEEMKTSLQNARRGLKVSVMNVTIEISSSLSSS